MPRHVRDLCSAVSERAPRDEVASDDDDVMLEAAERVSFHEAVDDDENAAKDVMLPRGDHVFEGGIFGQWRRGGAAGSASAEEKRPRDATTRAFRTLTTV